MISVTAQCVAAGAVCGIGLASMAGLAPAFADYSYPIVWWGLLGLADAWNWRRNGLSMWRGGRARRFLLVTIPVSVLYWLLFEALNLPAPQWRYRGGVDQVWAQVGFGFIAFATVIPIVVQAWWMVAGEFRLPAGLLARLPDRYLLAAVGIALMSVPCINDIFWFNQGMWIGPALVLLPFASIESGGSSGRLLRGAVAAGLLSGILWEAINFPSRTKWEYLILPEMTHLFEMPLPGFLGFIPFAAATMVVYQWQLKLAAKALIVLGLNLSAVAALYRLTRIYSERGLWLPN
jgi:hypothetical protein